MSNIISLCALVLEVMVSGAEFGTTSTDYSLPENQMF